MVEKTLMNKEIEGNKNKEEYHTRASEILLRFQGNSLACMVPLGT